jgi:hypothetical protein
MSQTELAYLAGRLAQADISRFERRRGKPSPLQASRLAARLGIRPDTPDALMEEVQPEAAAHG